MKYLVNKILKRKLLSLMFFIVLISLIFSFIFINILSNDNKDIIRISVNNFMNSIYTNKIVYKDIFFKGFTTNLILYLFIWFLGISIIGIPILLIILFISTFITSFTFLSIIYTFKVYGILLGSIYIIPHLLNFFFYFILIYYSLSFSKTLFNYFFRKKECNRRVLVRRYVKLLLFSFIFIFFTSIIETFFVPFLIKLIKL